jgi:hypothetical protein
MASDGPPAANGTTSVTGREGKGCATSSDADTNERLRKAAIKTRDMALVPLFPDIMRTAG